MPFPRRRSGETCASVGAYGGPPLAANADRLFILWGKCGIPSGAKAVTINIAVTGSTAGGDLRLYGGGALPNVSAINYAGGQTRANNAVIALGSSGELVVHCDQPSGTTQAILDVTGYFQ